MMRILNNWDLLDRNTAIYDLDTPVEGARRWYVVIDLGASLGRTKILPVSDDMAARFIRKIREKVAAGLALAPAR